MTSLVRGGNTFIQQREELESPCHPNSSSTGRGFATILCNGHRFPMRCGFATLGTALGFSVESTIVGENQVWRALRLSEILWRFLFMQCFWQRQYVGRISVRVEGLRNLYQEHISLRRTAFWGGVIPRGNHSFNDALVSFNTVWAMKSYLVDDYCVTPVESAFSRRP